MEQLPRCPTGIAKLDELLHGGFPVGHIILLAGASGTGKTVLSTEFLFRGADQYNERGLYLSLIESEQRMRRNVSGFTFYKDELVDSGKVQIKEIEHDAWLMGVQPQTVHDVLMRVKSTIEESKAQRVVIDSITAIGNNLKDESKVRELVFRLGYEITKLGCTMILISEIPPQSIQYSVFGVEEFVADGIILLSEFERNGELIRTLQIIKMRGVEHSRDRQIMEITSNGINLLPMFKSGI